MSRKPIQENHLRVRVGVGDNDSSACGDRSVLRLGRPARQRDRKHQEVGADVYPIGERKGRSEVNQNPQFYRRYPEQEEVCGPSPP
jgi:hypothetical protein